MTIRIDSQTNQPGLRVVLFTVIHDDGRTERGGGWCKGEATPDRIAAFLQRGTA